jgi:thiol-disulfide isomerase/thioredoxin
MKFLKIRSIFRLTTISCLLMACQSNSFKIKGHVKGLTEGDTLILTNNELSAINGDRSQGERIIIDKNGNFEYKGSADSVEECILYNPKSEYNFYVFYREPGAQLKMNLYTGPVLEDYNYITGTKLNNALTTITNKIEILQKNIAKIAVEYKIKDSTNKDYNKIEKISQQIRTIIIHSINDNINNELGYKLIIDYGLNWNINDNVIFSLIHKLPIQKKQRPEIKNIISELRKRSNSSIGKQITGFQMSSPEGKDISLYREIKKNKITIIDFWASWCDPCRKSISSLTKLYSKYHNKGLGIIGISLDAETNDLEKAIKEMNIKWVQMSDFKGWNNTGVEILGITTIPYTIVVDNKGIILTKELDTNELIEYIKERL